MWLHVILPDKAQLQFNKSIEGPSPSTMTATPGSSSAASGINARA
jgi:hypothetical protein